MEERRLKKILSHLSPDFSALATSNSATCNILNRKSKHGDREDGIGDRWNLPITVVDDSRLPPHCAQTLKLLEGCGFVVYPEYFPGPRSSSDLCDDIPSGPKDKSIREEKNIGTNGTDARFKQAAGRIRQNSFLPCFGTSPTGSITANAMPCTSQAVNAFPSLVDCNSVSNELTMQRCKGVLRTSLRVNDFEYRFQGGREGGACTSGIKELYGSVRLEANSHQEDRDVTCLADLKLETEQLNRSNRNEPAVEARTLAPRIFGEAKAILNRKYELNSVVEVTHLEARVREESNGSPTVQRAEDKKDTEVLHSEMSEMNREASCTAQVTQHQATVHNQPRGAVTRGMFKTLAKQDQQTTSFRSNRFNLEAVDYRSEAGGSVNLSRNNAMIGQRRSMAEDCIFCRIVEGRSPAFKLYEDEMCICILDVHPLSHGHSLIIPKAHFRSLELTPPEVAAAMCAVVPVISRAIMEATTCDSFNLLVNSGTAAGQVVFHTHFHIIPRRLGDNLWRSEGSCRGPLPLGHETSLLVQQIHHKLSGKHM